MSRRDEMLDIRADFDYRATWGEPVFRDTLNWKMIRAGLAWRDAQTALLEAFTKDWKALILSVVALALIFQWFLR